MDSKIKVSVIMPSLNMAPYIEKSLTSVTSQTLKDIEILCVDAGSEDGTIDIIKKIAASDERVKLINSERKSYGFQVNKGFECAVGEYLAIIETDDFAEKNCFEKLYTEATKDNLDICKAGFYYHWSVPEKKNVPVPVASAIIAGRVFCPRNDFKAPLEQIEIYNIKPSIWSAIYKRDFIEKNKIKFTETDGAAFQDTAFNFKVFALADRVRLLTDLLVYYRQDNELSSVNSKDKAFAICSEYQEIETFLRKYPELENKLEGVRVRLKYDAYLWNYRRLSSDMKESFLKTASLEFSNELNRGYADKKYFVPYKWRTFNLIADHPEKFTGQELGYKYCDSAAGADEEKTKNVKTVAYGALQCLRDHGIMYTISLAVAKAKDRTKH